jgi:hypothetical protein
MNNMKKQRNLSLIGFNAIVLLMACSFFLTSCTSLQQTSTAATDDLYFTPSKEAETTTRNNSNEATASEEAEYQDYQNYQDDRYLRLKVANRNRWSSIDDFGYWNNPRFNMGFGMGWGGGFGGWGGGFGFDPFWGGIGGWGGFGGWAGGLGGWGGGFGGWGGGFGGWGGGWGYDPFWDPFWGGGFGGWGGGFGGWGGGFGGWGGGFGGWGGWNPYYAGYWNPYRPIFYGGGVGNFPMQRNNYTPRALQTSAPALAAYRTNRNYNNANNFSNNTNGTTRYTGNPNLNSGFGNLLRRVTTNNTNANQANSFDRPARYFNNGGFSNSNQNKSSNSNTNTNTAPSMNNNAGGRSGGFNSSGSAPSSRPPRGGN